MVDSSAQPDLREWLHQLREDRLGDEQARHLAARLRESSEARSIYARYLILQACLELDWGRLDPSLPVPGADELFDDDSTELVADAPAGSTDESRAIAGAPVALPAPAATQHTSPVLGFLSRPLDLAAVWLSSPKAIALTVLGGLLTYFAVLVVSVIVGRMGSGQHDVQLAGPAAAPGPAVRAGSIRVKDQAVWSKDTPDHAGRVVGVGDHCRLTGGRVELELVDGTQLIIAAPADWQLDAQGRLLVNGGHVVAYVPPAARGFTVVTPTAEIVDLGTRFGVEVTDTEETRLVVTRGSVRVTTREASAAPDDAAEPRSNASGRLVTAGQAMTVSRAGNSRVIVESSRFDAPWVSGLVQLDESFATTPGEAIAFQAFPAGAAGTSPDGVEDMGVSFEVTRPIRVFSLGVFDHLGDGISPESKLTTCLWSYDDHNTPDNSHDDTGIEKLAEATFTADDPGMLKAGHRFKRLPHPVVLPRGLYCLITHGFGGNNKNFGSPLFDKAPAEQRGVRPELRVETCRYAIVPTGWRFFERPPQHDEFPIFHNKHPVFYFAGSFTFEPVDE